jgi:DNA-binding NtrC family response regulator
MKDKGKVLVSWIAVNNDPYERVSGKNSFRLVNGTPLYGPTLTVLFSKDSSFNGQISDVLFLHGKTKNSKGDREKNAFTETITEIKRIQSGINIHDIEWLGDDPTDHSNIFQFLRETIPAIRRKFAGRELVIHISPGTPSMQTIWVLMAETGFIESPFQLIKSYREVERHGQSAVVPVHLGIETFYKVYKTLNPLQVSSEEQTVLWDVGKFQTDKMNKLFKEARRFAQLNVPVLILGERGTGKTTLASWIRLHSPFRQEEQDSHWPVVACGQYNPETMRAELFGYKKGSFTGASKDKEGLLAIADGDTLFLDEVGDVSRDLQRLLIKALEEKQYMALGDDRTHKSNFRLLTATNIGMNDLLERLDPDFLDRISLLTLMVPALREIREELNWLWESVYESAFQRANIHSSLTKLSKTHNDKIISHLKKHPLPGNLRDLFRIAYRIIAARYDPLEPLSPSEAVDYGIQSLENYRNKENVEREFATEIAKAFATKSTLDTLIDQHKRLSTKSVMQELKRYLSSELRRLAKSRNIPVKKICDVSERTLRTWAD